VIVDNADPKGITGDYDHTVDLSGLTGQYIRVETTKAEYLSFTELRAFAAVPEPASLLLALFGLAGSVAIRRRTRGSATKYKLDRFCNPVPRANTWLQVPRGTVFCTDKFHR